MEARLRGPPRRHSAATARNTLCRSEALEGSLDACTWTAKYCTRCKLRYRLLGDVVTLMGNQQPGGKCEGRALFPVRVDRMSFLVTRKTCMVLTQA